ncbi:MAG: 3-hydroxyacyl-CoA dehydrogenase NAD-binding domain-containing protein [Thalassolituus sp.]|uniref:Fatty oxidation complex, alpha subunit n=4 Tax=root TaxID=1 RepID=M5DMM7_9GAMM|nr:3-hydroxyacyl-CoA dehydrogenase NAD-binding domain-containing protein [Thalassolituus oleivorans]MBQ0727838.1 enoyl-CoA hydratase/isomerase family protein [Thalassolituus oleivorans]MDF1639597.1 3-hydroxyacyl-CoA dehydrogenase NAD-binding domain-containing protein [Thalassolituus oleivorans]CCU71155.1 fatty oxidation complex, alpha subunit [Thalassolituus oleivorans MIL-1]
MANTMFTHEIDDQGIVVLTWNDQSAPVNSLAQAAVAGFAEVLESLLVNDAVKGIVLTSGKSDFIVGANLHEIQTMPQDPATIMGFIRKLHVLMRRMETAGKPVVAALNGTALGGGMEIALACHQRIAADNSKARFGFPEVNLGLLPGGGGTQRLARLLGIQAAMPWLLQATQAKPAEALAAGLIHAVVPADQLISAAKEWALNNPKAIQPWDDKKFRLPGGEVQSAKAAQAFMGAEAMLRKKTQGNYLAPQAILQTLFEGCQLPIDAALEIEAKYFTELLLSDQAKAMIRTFFVALQDANKLKNRPKDVEKKQFKKVGILGAGMMGAGIAYSSTLSGMDVVLLDTKQEAADRGKAYSEGILKKRVTRGKMTQEKADAQLGRILATTDFNDLAGCDLVIEAVFEDRTIKADVTAKAEAVIGSDAIFASNTSTLPITGLAQASQRPEQFIGLHFFSPVDKMPLVEIIMGEQTSQHTLAWALDYVQQLRKTPIVVNDSRGFYTSRVFSTYVMEGMALLKEGVAPALIENAGKKAGMPVGPLALSDEVTLELMNRIGTQTRKDLGDAYVAHPADEVVKYMVEEADRIGKRTGKGFYDYPATDDKTAKKMLWSGLAERFPLAVTQPDADYVVKRLLHVQAVETLRCVSEGVITRAHEVDIGSIFGWGFAPHTGGTISYVETIIGMDRFIAEANELADAVGERYRVPANVIEKAAAGSSFY